MNCLIHDGEPRSLPPVFKGVPAHLVNQGCDTSDASYLKATNVSKCEGTRKSIPLLKVR